MELLYSQGFRVQGLGPGFWFAPLPALSSGIRVHYEDPAPEILSDGK